MQKMQAAVVAASLGLLPRSSKGQPFYSGQRSSERFWASALCYLHVPRLFFWLTEKERMLATSSLKRQAMPEHRMSKSLTARKPFALHVARFFLASVWWCPCLTEKGSPS